MIEVGEYVRTIKGISKIIDDLGKITDNNYYYEVDKNGTDKAQDSFKEFTTTKNIIGHSKNIIDLIEVGDYVNGYYVERVWEQVNYRMAIDLRGSYLGLSDDKFIYSIVTKEQFKNIEYRLED